MSLILSGDASLGSFSLGQKVPLCLSLQNTGAESITLPAQIVFDDLFFKTVQRDGATYALVVGPPGSLPPGGRAMHSLAPGQHQDIALADFVFRWQECHRGSYRFELYLVAEGQQSSVQVVEFALE